MFTPFSHGPYQPGNRGSEGIGCSNCAPSTKNPFCGSCTGRRKGKRSRVEDESTFKLAASHVNASVPEASARTNSVQTTTTSRMTLLQWQTSLTPVASRAVRAVMVVVVDVSRIEKKLRAHTTLGAISTKMVHVMRHACAPTLSRRR